MTFVFTDIEGSAGAWDTHHRAMDEALSIHDRIVAGAVDRHDGYVFSTGGDGVAIAFQSARAGVAASVELQRSIAAAAWPEPLRLRVRIGINTGDAIERDGDYFGPAVIRAARLMSLVDGGRTVCSDTTAASVASHLPDDVQLVSLGRTRLRGLSGVTEVFALAGKDLDEPRTRLVESASSVRRPPRALTPLLGREIELAHVTAAMDDHLLVTITGIGGIGKTRLAQEAALAAADRFEEVAWADLATAPDALAARHEIATSLGVRAQSGDDVASGIAAVLRARRLLLVLDNCEHVREDISSLLSSETQRDQASRILATSRERLGPPYEHAISLGPITDHDAALALLADRLGTSASADDLAAIVDHVDGIPLAIELAAARCRVLGVSEVAARLDTRRRMLADELRPVERHRVLADVIRWSYEHLDTRARTVFRRVAVFAGAFPLVSAEAVAGGTDLDADDVDAAVAALVEESLVLRVGHRFRLLHPVRQFAAGELDRDPDVAAVLDRHLEDTVQRLRTVHDGLLTPEERRWVDELDAMWPDLRAAQARASVVGDAVAAIQIATHIANEAFLRRPEAFAWIRATVDQYGDVPGPLRSALLGAGSYVAWTTLDLARGLELGTAAMAAADPDAVAFDNLPQAGIIGALNFSGRAAEAAQVAADVIDRHGAAMNASIRATMIGGLLISRVLAGESGVEPMAQRALTQETSGASPSSVGLLWYTLAFARFFVGDVDGAATALDRARMLAESVGNQWLMGLCAAPAVVERDPAKRVARCLEAVDDYVRAGWTTHGWALAWQVVDALVELGELDLAASWLGACERSGVARMHPEPLDAALVAAADGTGDPALVAAVERGRSATFDDLRSATLIVV